MSELSVGQLRGLTVNDNVITVPSGHTLVAPSHVIQVVRATDTAQRSTTSTSFTDANISVSITPKLANSNILLVWSLLAGAGHQSTNPSRAMYAITDANNVAIQGAERAYIDLTATNGGITQIFASFTLIGWVAASTTATRTYKGRFASNTANCIGFVQNHDTTGQLIAMEIAS